MDDARFDRLVRLFSTPRSRRATIASLLGGVIGARTAAADAHKTRRNAKRGKSKRDKRKPHTAAQAAADSPSCRTQGHPCEGNQTCCAPFVCVVSGPGDARRCTPCPSGTVYFEGACCTPTTCAGAGAECGTIDDGCGGHPDCGECSGPETCGGGQPGVPNICGCTPEPDTTTCAGKCGPVTNNCGQEIDCTALCSDCCDGDICWPRCNGVCVDRLTDHDNCGDCGVTCGNLVCYHGNCCTEERDPDFPDQPDICVCAEEGWACDGTPGTCCQYGECTAGVCPGPEHRHLARGQPRVRGRRCRRLGAS
jgi:hypothetical protein